MSLFKEDNRNTRKICEVSSKVTTKTPEQLWTYFTFFSSVSTVDSEQVNVSWESCLGPSNFSYYLLMSEIAFRRKPKPQNNYCTVNNKHVHYIIQLTFFCNPCNPCSVIRNHILKLNVYLFEWKPFIKNLVPQVSKFKKLLLLSWLYRGFLKTTVKKFLTSTCWIQDNNKITVELCRSRHGTVKLAK